MKKIVPFLCLALIATIFASCNNHQEELDAAIKQNEMMIGHRRAPPFDTGSDQTNCRHHSRRSGLRAGELIHREVP